MSTVPALLKAVIFITHGAFVVAFTKELVDTTAYQAGNLNCVNVPICLAIAVDPDKTTPPAMIIENNFFLKFFLIILLPPKFLLNNTH